MNEELKALAGEYVLGLLSGQERANAEIRMRTDDQFRATVERFAASMHELDAAAPPASVPAEMWERIAASISNTPQEVKGQSAKVVEIRSKPATPTGRQWMALAASLLVGVGFGYMGREVLGPSEQPVVVVVLNTQQNTPGAIFEAFADNSVRIVPLQDFDVPDGKMLQVWTLYDKAVGPVSLGTMARSDIIKLDGKALPVPADNQLYEITLEPSPGSPTGKPTGPILVKGFAKRPIYSRKG